MQRVRPPAYSFPSDPSALLSLQKSQLPSVHLAVSLAARGAMSPKSPLTYQLTKHQSRYKMKQLKKVEDLETSIQQLQRNLSAGVMSNTTVWNVAAEYFRMFRYGLVSLEYTADGLVIGKTLGRLTITENTLYHAFPHLIGAGEGEERAELARRLLGQQLVMRGAVHFEWDSENGRIARLHHKADLLTPLLELLGSLEEVSRVFENALVTPESTSVTWGKL
ncbi:hypothetical protein GQ600_9740 [Phytophthora cactorum]|nr:hypothetical protein GQ600_9740 [Phytophthora cactorum]